MPAVARQDVPTPQQRELEHLRQRIEQTRQEHQRLMRERQALEREAQRISRDLVHLAARAQALEQRIDQGRQRIARLQRQRGKLLARLAANHKATTQLLAALQRLRRDPPPPFVTRPGDVLAAVRGALALGAVLPRMNAQAMALRSNLEKLARLRQQLHQEQVAQRRNLAALRETSGKLQGMLKLKQDLLKRTNQQLAARQRQLARLLKQATTLEELLSAVERQRRLAARQPATKDNAQETPEPRAASSPKPKELASNTPSRSLAGLPPFNKLRGRLPWPAQGRKVGQFGQRSPLLGELKGLYIATLSGALITAPSAAKVLLSGPFRGYGKLVILNAGQDYRILLAGMQEVSVRAGEQVRAGEPLGRMGTRPAPSTIVDENVAAGRPILYMELRKGRKLLDPSRWLVGAQRQAGRK